MAIVPPCTLRPWWYAQSVVRFHATSGPPAERKRMWWLCRFRRLQQGDALFAELIGHRGGRVLGTGKAHQPPRRSRREVEPLDHVPLEALEAELPVQPTVDQLLEHDLEVHFLEERNGPSEASIQLFG
jgi:hypothetical protein